MSSIKIEVGGDKVLISSDIGRESNYIDINSIIKTVVWSTKIDIFILVNGVEMQHTIKTGNLENTKKLQEDLNRVFIEYNRNKKVYV